MDKVIGLGKLGCAIAEELSKHPEYRIYKIAPGFEERGSLELGDYNTHEECEATVDQDEVTLYLRSIKPQDEILLLVEGGDPASGAILRILETIKDSRLNVLYLCPERSMISETQKQADKLCFNVLQEYARSGVFESIFLVDAITVDKLVGEVSIQKYEQSISHFISYIVAMINYFHHTEPVLSTKIEPNNIARIVTFGISSLEEEKNETSLLFPLNETRDIHFFYGVPEKDLEEDPTLIRKIKDHVKSYKEDNVSSSFSVYSTTFDSLMVLCLAYSSRIQPLIET